MRTFSFFLLAVTLFTASGCVVYDTAAGLSEGERAHIDRMRRDRYTRVVRAFRDTDGSVIVHCKHGGELIRYRIVKDDPAQHEGEDTDITYSLKRLPKHVPVGG